MVTRRYRPYKPLLTIKQILAWADAYHRRHGRWPHAGAGRIPGAKKETWAGVSGALANRSRGITRKTTIGRLLAQERGVLVRRAALTADIIFKYAQAHHRQTGRWPHRRSGKVIGSPGETWTGLDSALKVGSRGIRGGSSLHQLLVERGVLSPWWKGPLVARQILAWADDFHEAHGHWPFYSSGLVNTRSRLTWDTIDKALKWGRHGLPGGSSLPWFLNEHRGIFLGMKHRPHRTRAEKLLDVKMIRAWARAHHRRTGEWPQRDTGPIPKSGGQTWVAVNAALRLGYRGLPGGSSLAKIFGARPPGPKPKRKGKRSRRRNRK
jgi:hypothetical protein